jgi:ribose transport system permease protein
MKKILGIFGLLVAVLAIAITMDPSFASGYSIEKLIGRSSLYAIMSIGAAIVIVTSGIDLSIGAVVGLVGVLLPLLVRATDHDVLPGYGWPPALAVAFVLGLSLVIGLVHGLMITKLRLQPFIVTLCGLMIYRGLARLIASDTQQGFQSDFLGLRALSLHRFAVPGIDKATFAVPAPAVFLVVIALAAAVFLNMTIYGRYLLALGRNELAAKYSGIKTHRMVILAYVISSFLAGLTGVLFVLDINAAPPSSFGETYELWAIAAAVLGGCSLRGGEGTILGVVIGAAVLQVLRTAIVYVTSYQYIELLIIGVVLLIGVIVDELVKRLAARRRATRLAA